MIGSGAAALTIAALAWWMTREGGAEQEGAGALARSGAARAAGSAHAHRPRIDPATVARGAIAGTVRDPRGAAVAGAEVCAYASSDELSAEDTRDPRCAASGADGRYRVAGLLPARYEVHAGAPQYMPGQYRDAERRADDLHLAAGEERGGIDIVLRPGGVELAGSVKDIGGGTVGGAWVRAGSERWGPSPRAQTRSRADGSFRLWVAPGRVALTAQAEGYVPGRADATAPGLTVDILLTPEAVLAGRVVEVGGGAPVAGARVGVGSSGGMEDASPEAHGSAVTDEQGRFRIARLPPGRYKAFASAPTGSGEARESVLLGLGQTVDGVTIELHPAALVVGRVLEAGNRAPCRDGWVGLSDHKAGRHGGAAVEVGRVEIEAMLPGTYEVHVQCRGFRAQDEYPALVIAAGAAPPEQEWTVRAGCRIRGAVRSAEGAPVARAWISARPAGPMGPRSARDSESAPSEEDGSFLIDGLRAGTYEVSVEAADLPPPEEPQRVTVAEGGEAAVELRLERAGGVAGDVVDEAGRPVPGVTVRAQGQARWSMAGAGGTMTRDDGSFALEGLRPGTYRVAAMRGGDFGWRAALRAPGKGDDDVAGQPVRVVAGETAHARLVVESQSSAIRGRVVDPQGSPITDAYVDAERESESAAAAAGGARRSMRWSWARTPVLTDTDGRFALEKLSAGRYTVRGFRRGGGEALAEGIAAGASVTLTIRRTGSIAGKVVVAGGRPPETMIVTLGDRQTGFSRTEHFFRTGGELTVRDLPAGSFEIAVSAPEGTGHTVAQLAEGQNLTGLSIELEARAAVTGRAVDLEGGAPLAGFRVHVQPIATTSFSVGMSRDQEVSGADGRFRVEDAPAGRVQLLLFPTEPGASSHGMARRIAVLEAGRTTDVGDVRVPERRLKPDQLPGDLGFVLKQNPPDTEPGNEVLAVAVVRADGPAARAGLQVGDVIAAIDGHDVRGDASLYHSLASVPPGQSVTLGLASGAAVKITAGQPR